MLTSTTFSVDSSTSTSRSINKRQGHESRIHPHHSTATSTASSGHPDKLTKSAAARPTSLQVAGKRPTSIKNLISFFETTTTAATHSQNNGNSTCAVETNPRLKAAQISTMMSSTKKQPSVGVRDEGKPTATTTTTTPTKLGRHLSMFVSPAYEASIISPVTADAPLPPPATPIYRFNQPSFAKEASSIMIKQGAFQSDRRSGLTSHENNANSPTTTTSCSVSGSSSSRRRHSIDPLYSSTTLESSAVSSNTATGTGSGSYQQRRSQRIELITAHQDLVVDACSRDKPGVMARDDDEKEKECISKAVHFRSRIVSSSSSSSSGRDHEKMRTTTKTTNGSCQNDTDGTGTGAAAAIRARTHSLSSTTSQQRQQAATANESTIHSSTLPCADLDDSYSQANEGGVCYYGNLMRAMSSNDEQPAVQFGRRSLNLNDYDNEDDNDDDGEKYESVSKYLSKSFYPAAAAAFSNKDNNNNNKLIQATNEQQQQQIIESANKSPSPSLQKRQQPQHKKQSQPPLTPPSLSSDHQDCHHVMSTKPNDESTNILLDQQPKEEDQPSPPLAAVDGCGVSGGCNKANTNPKSTSLASADGTDLFYFNPNEEVDSDSDDEDECENDDHDDSTSNGNLGQQQQQWDEEEEKGSNANSNRPRRCRCRQSSSRRKSNGNANNTRAEVTAAILDALRPRSRVGGGVSVSRAKSFQATTRTTTSPFKARNAEQLFGSSASSQFNNNSNNNNSSQKTADSAEKILEITTTKTTTTTASSSSKTTTTTHINPIATSAATRNTNQSDLVNSINETYNRILLNTKPVVFNLNHHHQRLIASSPFRVELFQRAQQLKSSRTQIHNNDAEAATATTRKSSHYDNDDNDDDVNVQNNKTESIHRHSHLINRNKEAATTTTTTNTRLLDKDEKEEGQQDLRKVEVEAEANVIRYQGVDGDDDENANYNNEKKKCGQEVLSRVTTKDQRGEDYDKEVAGLHRFRDHHQTAAKTTITTKKRTFRIRANKSFSQSSIDNFAGQPILHDSSDSSLDNKDLTSVSTTSTASSSTASDKINRLGQEEAILAPMSSFSTLPQLQQHRHSNESSSFWSGIGDGGRNQASTIDSATTSISLEERSSNTSMELDLSPSPPSTPSHKETGKKMGFVYVNLKRLESLEKLIPKRLLSSSSSSSSSSSKGAREQPSLAVALLDQTDNLCEPQQTKPENQSTNPGPLHSDEASKPSAPASASINHRPLVRSNTISNKQSSSSTKPPNMFFIRTYSTTTSKNADRDQVLKHSSSFSCTRRFDPSNIQKRVLEWCQAQTKSYKNVKITNFSSSWADGLAFCALIHSFLPDAFDYDKLNGTNRRQNFELAFETANQRANIAPLLEVSDMINMGNKPDDKCVYTYVSTIFTRFQKLRPRLYQSTQQQQLQQIQQQHLVNEQAIKRQ